MYGYGNQCAKPIASQLMQLTYIVDSVKGRKVCVTVCVTACVCTREHAYAKGRALLFADVIGEPSIRAHMSICVMPAGSACNTCNTSITHILRHTHTHTHTPAR